MQTSAHHTVLIVGGGAGGLAVAAALRRARPSLDIAVIEPSEHQDYQPGWTLVGGGAMRAEATRRPMARFIPRGVSWIRDRAEAFEPHDKRVLLQSGSVLGYDRLIVAAGLQLDWQRVDGLVDALGHGGVTSNYRYDLAPYTWQCVQNLRSGRALFTQPAMPIKCAGAPQKVLYLAADHWRRTGRAVQAHFFTQGPTMFGVPVFAEALAGIMRDYGAIPHFGHNLTAVDAARREATFQTAEGASRTEAYDLLHVTPPQSAPDFIKSSPLADAAGWLDVDPHTLRHTRYPDVFGLGDCTNTPNAKTAAAVRRQFPVVVAGVLGDLAQGRDSHRYDGYGGCPLTTAHGRVLLAEFRYQGEVVPSFPLDPRRPRRSYWWLKRYGFPWLYWHVLLRGRDWSWPHPRPRSF